MRWQSTIVPAIAAALGAFAMTALPEQAAAPQGRSLFEKRCSGCHDLDGTKVGPPLRHVFARHSASDPRFHYSEALKKARITWDAASLDRWLLNPDAVVPDNDMPFRLENAEERAAIIAYLRASASSSGP